MTEQEFNDLIKKYNRGHASPEESAMVEEWLEKREESRLFGNLSNKERDNLKRSLYNRIERQMFRMDDQFSVNTAIKKRFFNIRVAAALVFLCIASIGVWYFTYSGQSEDTVLASNRGVGSIKKVILSDGSLVWLKGDSQLTYPEEFTGPERVVTLEGEGLFEITKAVQSPGLIDRILGNRSVRKPFIVRCGEMETRVLGTSFNIKNELGQTEVFVLTGKVAVSSFDNEESIELLPKEKVVYIHREKLLKKMDRVEDVKTNMENNNELYSNYIEGTEYDMNFENTEMSEVASRVEEKFEIPVRLTQSLDSCLIRANFTDQSLVNTLEMIAEALNASYEIRDSIIFMSGRGCY